MTLPGPDALRELAAWSPDGGVLSVYVRIDPADRALGWRVELVDRLKEVLRSAEGNPHGTRLAMRATAQHVLERFPEQGPPPQGRCHVGFVQVAQRERERRELWYSAQISPRQTEAVWGHRPYLRPLVELHDNGGPIGIATVSGDRVRLWEWELGIVREADDWEWGAFFDDWRERKAQRPADPARGHGASSAGRDQFHQRVEAQRERFLGEAGARTAGQATGRGWRELIVFGDSEALGRFAEGLGPHEARLIGGKNIVSEDASRIAERVGELLPELNRDRELKLVEQVKESAYAGKARGSLGPQETLEALVQGRVEHLLFDADRDYRGHGIEEGLAYEGPPLGEDGLPVAELMIERALETGARITPLEGDAAAALEDNGGVAALLRY